MKTIDFRSDTVTRPTPGMRAAMAAAEVGDDVFGDDPTVNALQAELAAHFGKEAGLFVPSGTMANQIALLCHCRPGDHVLVPGGAHVVHYEGGAGAAWAGVQFRELGEHGRYDLAELSAAVQPDDHHHPPTTLITLESTHNASGGRVVPVDHILAVKAVADAHGLPLHLDGARLFNALATGQDAAEIGGLVDSLWIALSKGLGAPIGSVLLGDRAFIDRAHRYRKMLGGALRQVGILAAAGRYALANHVDRLADDHVRARRLCAGLAEIEGLSVDPDAVETNMVYFQLSPALALDGPGFAEATAARGLLCHPSGPREIRWVTHLDVDDAAVDEALAIAGDILRS